jgi:hypothetical protein
MSETNDEGLGPSRCYPAELVVRCWGCGVTEPLYIRTNDEGDIDFTTDHRETINADIILHCDDALVVGQWLIDFAKSNRSG